MARRTADVPTLVSRAREGDQRSVARLISLVEDDSGLLREVMTTLTPYVAQDRAVGRGAHVIGLTGPPGVGKSTTTSALVGALRAQGKRVGVLAIDPSSPFTGGALLGDRIRMQEHGLDKGVYIRSMASRGHLGGLSVATPQALRVLDAAGCEVILIETVGVGQSEVEIASMADTTLVLLAPGMGDGIQAAKAGILEIGDVYVVNKSDREGAQQLRRELRSMMSHTQRPVGAWRPPIVNTVASAKEGMEELVEEIDNHWQHLVATSELEQRRVQRARTEIEAIALASYRRKWRGVAGGGLNDLAAGVVVGTTDPYAAADQLISG